MLRRKHHVQRQGRKDEAALKETVIVTGASGLIGSTTIRRLARSFRVMAFDIEQPQAMPGVEWVNVDLTSDTSVERGLQDVHENCGEHIASVVHLAAYYDFSGEPSPKYEAVTVRGTERLLRGLQSFDVGQFIFSSSMLVHAPCRPGEHINEDWPLDPRWDYPKSKMETEKLILAERGSIPAALLRISGVYDDYCHSLPLAHQIQRIYERQMISHLFPGHISHGQAFLHAEDLVDAFQLLLDCRPTLPSTLTLLLGEPEILSYDELQELFGSLLHNEKWETREIPKSVAKAEIWIENSLPLAEEPFIKPWMVDFADDHYALDISRARKVLGWEPGRRLRETLPKMVAALKADPHGWYRAHRLHEGR